jgi:hypothetical protein
MPDQKVATLLRLRRDLKEKLAQLAKQEHRSLNQEIEFILERFLLDNKPTKSTDPVQDRQGKSRKS